MLALILLSLGCSTVELVGVDRESREDEEQPDAAPAPSDAALPAFADARQLDATAVMRDAIAPADAALAVWRDPQRPAPFPNQYINDKFPSPGVSGSPCPPNSASQGAPCTAEGVECRYPRCWGGAHRTFVCVEGRFELWYDEAFKCAPDRPCPTARPRDGSSCSLVIECLYPTVCCDGGEGYERAHCDGAWHLAGPYGCDECPSRPRS